MNKAMMNVVAEGSLGFEKTNEHIHNQFRALSQALNSLDDKMEIVSGRIIDVKGMTRTRLPARGGALERQVGKIAHRH